MAKKTPITLWINLITNTKSKLWAWIKVIVFGGLALLYMFWALDIIPDTIGGPVGYIDDAIIWLFAAWAIRGAIKTIWEKKGDFISNFGGKK